MVRKLVINTRHPVTVHLLLMQYDLIDHSNAIHGSLGLLIDYPDDALSQELIFWFALAQGCGLVSEYRLDFSTKGTR